MKAIHCALALALTGAAVSGAHAAAVAETRRFALVVAENRPFDSKMTALQYADDDALRYAELTEAGVHRSSC
jgi:TRAP-type C4-dicarboxylate transport system substrate-binding protein